MSTSSDRFYLDVFVVNFSKSNDIDLTVSGNLTVPDSFMAGESPSESVVQEFDLTRTIFGGGKSLLHNKLRFRLTSWAERRAA